MENDAKYSILVGHKRGFGGIRAYIICRCKGCLEKEVGVTNTICVIQIKSHILYYSMYYVV